MPPVYSKGLNAVPLATLIQEGSKCPTVTAGDISIEVMHDFEKAAQKFSTTKTLVTINKSLKSLTVSMTIGLLIGLRLIVIDLST